MAVRVQAGHELDALDNRLVAKGPGTASKLGPSVWLSSPSGFHRIDVGCFIVAKIREGSDVKGGHHVVVLMDQIVTMEHIDSVPLHQRLVGFLGFRILGKRLTGA